VTLMQASPQQQLPPGWDAPQQQQHQQQPCAGAPHQAVKPVLQQTPQQPRAPYHPQQQQQQQYSPNPNPLSSWQQGTAPHPGSSSSNSRGWRPGIGSRVCSSWPLLSAAAAGNVVLLCETLGEPAWHVDAELTRLQHWLRLTFHFRWGLAALVDHQ
jgi:hypothetical protein